MKGCFLTSIYLTDDYRFSLAYLGASRTLVPGKSILRDLTLQFVNLIILSKDTILLRHLIRRMERSLEFRTERTGIFQWEIPRGLLGVTSPVAAHSAPLSKVT